MLQPGSEDLFIDKLKVELIVSCGEFSKEMTHGFRGEDTLDMLGDTIIMNGMLSMALIAMRKAMVQYIRMVEEGTPRETEGIYA